MMLKPDRAPTHEMCSSDYRPVHCVRFANVRSVTTALSGESQSAVWRGSDRDRKRFNPIFCKTNACYGAKLSAASAARRRRSPVLQEFSHSLCPELVVFDETGGAGPSLQ